MHCCKQVDQFVRSIDRLYYETLLLIQLLKPLEKKCSIMLIEVETVDMCV